MAEPTSPRRIAVLTGTRADYGKLKPLMVALDRHPGFELEVLVTGMHLLEEYGATRREIEKDGYRAIYAFPNHTGVGDFMDVVLARTVEGIGARLRDRPVSLLVVHGDRVEALAGAIAGALNNTRVAHIEGGEVSGTIDESLRHSVTKLAHFHFVANQDARRRILQLGERSEQVFVIGSPDIDVMLSDGLPALEDVRERYEIGFAEYGIAMLHPVTTSPHETGVLAEAFVDALLESGKSYVVIHPNNDAGRQRIMAEYARLEGNPDFRLLPSMRFEHFLTLLRNARLVVGNSSVGIREAGVYGVPSIDIGDRQSGRAPEASGVRHVPAVGPRILAALEESDALRLTPESHFGSGDSSQRFIQILEGEGFWGVPIQKLFVDID